MRGSATAAPPQPAPIQGAEATPPAPPAATRAPRPVSPDPADEGGGTDIAAWIWGTALVVVLVALGLLVLTLTGTFRI